MTGSDRIEERKKRKEASFRVSTAAEQAGRRGARLFSGAVVLAMAGIFVKVLGMIYKIPLTNLLGDEGMGYFNAAYTIYTLFFVLATSGMPVALSLLISESLARGEEKRAGQIYRAASRLSSKAERKRITVKFPVVLNRQPERISGDQHLISAGDRPI